jgi:hypothetical protein
MGNRVVSAKRLPVCEVTSNAVGVATNFPIGLTYEELLYWYWVPNLNYATISSNASISSYIIDDNGHTANSSVSFQPSVISGYYKYGNPITITNEHGLVCPEIYSSFTKQFNDSHCTDPIEEKYACMTDTINSLIVIDFNQINLHNGLYYPYVYADISGSDFTQNFHPEEEDGSNGSFGWSTEFGSENPIPGYYQLWYSIQLQVFNKTAYIYGGIADYGPSTVSGWSYTLPSYLSLIPKNYWAYSTRDGRNVYDELTGEQLNSPFA